MRKWESTSRAVHVGGADDARLLVVPESENPGWRARLGNLALRPVVVNGWQQGFQVPAGASGTVALDFGYDTGYRWSLLIGFVLLAVLFVAAMVPTRRRVRPEESPERSAGTPSSVVILAALGWLTTSWLLTGIWGLAVSVVVGAVVAVLEPRARVVLAFVAMMAATVGLAAGPWHAEAGYTGFSWWVQLPAFVAVASTVWSALVAAVPESTRRWALARLPRAERFASRRRSQARDGSSTKA